jgi:hypothetical protein
MYNTHIIYQGMGRRLIDFSERLLFFFPSLSSSPVQSFLDIRFFLCAFCSERFPLWLYASSGRTRSDFLLHLWEVCMSGILKTDQPHGYEQVHSAGFISFSLMSVGRWLGISLLSMACHS